MSLSFELFKNHSLVCKNELPVAIKRFFYFICDPGHIKAGKFNWFGRNPVILNDAKNQKYMPSSRR
jgi:hypothetical protein